MAYGEDKCGDVGSVEGYRQKELGRSAIRDAIQPRLAHFHLCCLPQAAPFRAMFGVLASHVTPSTVVSAQLLSAIEYLGSGDRIATVTSSLRIPEFSTSVISLVGVTAPFESVATSTPWLRPQRTPDSTAQCNAMWERV